MEGKGIRTGDARIDWPELMKFKRSFTDPVRASREASFHLLGPHSDETINLFALAMKSGLSASELGATIFDYPTLSSDVQYMF